MAKLPGALDKHRQLEDASCAVSGFEAVAKLHGLIPNDEFPLQSDPKNQKRGFNDTKFLADLGIDANDDFYNTDAAVDLIESETAAGRSPLISLIGQSPTGEWGYHIFLCTRHEGELLLIDPAKPSVEVAGKDNLRAVLENNRLLNPERKTLHVLKYQTNEKPQISQELRTEPAVPTSLPPDQTDGVADSAR